MLKKAPIIWDTFTRNFFTKNFKKSPNLVTLEIDSVRESETKRVRGRVIVSVYVTEGNLFKRA